MDKKIIAAFKAFILMCAFLAVLTCIPDSRMSVLGQVGTSVGGILWDNTTWTSENSPYTVTETVQIPENVTLTIESGVTVICPPSEVAFLVSGLINAHGTINNKIIFDGGGSSQFFREATSEPFVNLSYCIIRNGYALGTSMPSFNLSYSEVINVNGLQTNLLSPEPTYIEYNIFVNWGGIKAWAAENQIHIRNNVFKGSEGGALITYILTPGFDVKYNSFLDMDTTVLSLSDDYSSSDVNATNNYWGTTNTSIIDSLIRDGADDIEIQGFIEYMPILTEPHPDTPVFSVTPEMHTFEVTVETQSFNITTLSNSTISDFSFNQTAKELKFNAESLTGTTGFCNLSIPADLMWGNFSIYMDATLLIKDVDYTETFNGTHYLFSINYEHSSHTIELVSTDVIPDFAGWLFLPFVTSATLLALALRKSKTKQRKK
jgi:hypothetical protein